MLGRERVANTYLGDGIAIPHGMLKDREMIRQTGIAVVQVPAGVEWNPGEQVRLVVGIAAASDEHLQILANLTQVLADADEVERLSTTSDSAVLVDRLTRAGDTQAPTGSATDEQLEGYASADVVVEGASGLHARPATFFVEVAKSFQAEVRVRHEGKVVNGKSLASLLSLGADAGSTLTLFASGPDDQEALRALQDAVASGLGEEQEEAEEAVPELPEWRPSGSATGVPGVAASPGIAIGPLWHLKRRHLVVERTARDPRVEESKLRKGIESARAELRDLYEEVRAKSGAGKASIFRAHEAFLDDPDLKREAVAAIRTGTSAGWSWREVTNARAQELSKVEDPLVAARAVDLRDVGQRVLRFLAESDDADAQLPDHPVILIAEDLAPSDTAAIDPGRAWASRPHWAGGRPTRPSSRAPWGSLRWSAPARRCSTRTRARSRSSTVKPATSGSTSPTRTSPRRPQPSRTSRLCAIASTRRATSRPSCATGTAWRWRRTSPLLRRRRPRCRRALRASA